MDLTETYNLTHGLGKRNSIDIQGKQTQSEDGLQESDSDAVRSPIEFIKYLEKIESS